MQDIRMETFLAVCDYMNFTKAADALGLTQPAVSRQMKSLEEYYQTMLFHYEGKKLSLTPAGETLHRFARLARSDEKHLLELLRKPAARPLRLGSTPTPGEFMLPSVLSDYLKKHPLPEVHMTIRNTEALLEMLDEGAIDLAVVEGNFPKRNYGHLLFSVQDFVPVGPSRRDFPVLSLDELVHSTLILREPGSGNREILESTLKGHNISLTDFTGLIEVNDIRVQKALVQRDCGIAFLFRAAILEEPELKVLPVEGFPLQHEINILWQKNSLFEKEYQELARCFTELFRF